MKNISGNGIFSFRINVDDSASGPLIVPVIRLVVSGNGGNSRDNCDKHCKQRHKSKYAKCDNCSDRHVQTSRCKCLYVQQLSNTINDFPVRFKYAYQAFRCALQSAGKTADQPENPGTGTFLITFAS